MAGSWGDLTTRVVSGVAMVAIGVLIIWSGGHVMRLGFAAITAGMVWELVRLLVPEARRSALAMAGVAGAALLGALYLPILLALPLLLAPAMAGIAWVPRHRVLYLSYAALILVAAFGMVQLREVSGIGWMLWLVLVVIATDIAGYFAGRAFGGPKFWPRVSPKKTWSGTVAGWGAAALVGVAFMGEVGPELIGLSIAVSMASQMGDMAESAMKRRVGAKDSSHLIPGHGGLLDRFDGMLGGAVFLLLIGPWAGLPVGVAG